MAKRRHPIAQWCQGTVSIAFVQLMARLPLPVARRVGRGIGRLAYALVPRVRRVGLANLDLAYGDDLSEAEKRRILREAAENVGVVAAEFGHIPRLHHELQAEYEVCGDDHLEQGRGAVLISAHLSNWEWFAPAVVQHVPKLAIVVRPLAEPRLNALIDRTRRTLGVETLAKTGAGTDVLRRLRDGWAVGILVDQSPRDNAVPVTFFGAPCWATAAPVVAAVRARVPVHAMSAARLPDGRYRFEIGPAIEMAQTGDFRADLAVNAQRCQDAIEALVRAHPGQWLWLHRRWKARPRLEQKQAREAAVPRDGGDGD